VFFKLTSLYSGTDMENILPSSALGLSRIVVSGGRIIPVEVFKIVKKESTENLLGRFEVIVGEMRFTLRRLLQGKQEFLKLQVGFCLFIFTNVMLVLILLAML
jgi:hypothetical protein